MKKLAAKKCSACDCATESLTAADQKKLLKDLGQGWKIAKNHHLEKEFKFKDFKEALAFTNKTGAIAEKLGHHPDIYLAWGKVLITIFTHKINGLTSDDFGLAAKIEEKLGQ